MADKAAVAAGEEPEQCITVYYQDWYPIIQRKIEQEWKEEWQISRQKLKEIKSEVTQWKRVSGVSRAEEVIMNKLRAGHCRMSHEHLMKQYEVRAPPTCVTCRSAIVTVKHVLLECPAYNMYRHRLSVFQRLRLISLKDILGERACIRELMIYLQSNRRV